MRIPQVFPGLLGSFVVTLVSIAGCDEQQGALCKDSFNAAQKTVNQIDSSSIESVEKSLKSVTEAIAACKQEGKSGEVSELSAARNKISAHYEWLKARPAKQRKRTPEELEQLV